jgi:hypothetical protein
MAVSEVGVRAGLSYLGGEEKGRQNAITGEFCSEPSSPARGVVGQTTKGFRILADETGRFR